MQELSPRQREALDFLTGYIRAWKEAPSIREMAAALGISPNAVNDLVKHLEAKGYIRRMPGTIRGLRLVRRPTAAPVDGGPAPVCVDRNVAAAAIQGRDS